MTDWMRERRVIRLRARGVIAGMTAVLALGAACDLDLDVIPGEGGGGTSVIGGGGADGGGGAASTSGGAGGVATCDVDACESLGPAEECMKWGCVEDRCTLVPDDEQTVPCYSGPVDTQNVGVCVGGVAACVAGRPGVCEDEIVPAADGCENNVDEDCDGEDAECSGEVEWARFLPGVGRPQVIRLASEIIVAGRYSAGPSGADLVLGGACAPLPSPPGSFFIARFDTGGACLSLDVIGASTGNVTIESLERFDTGRLAVTFWLGNPVTILGQTYTPVGAMDGVIIGIDPGPTFAWRALLSGSGNETFNKSAVDAAGLVTAGAITVSDATITDADGTVTALPGSDGSTDALLAAFDVNGQLRYARRVQAAGATYESIGTPTSGPMVRIVGSAEGTLDLGGGFSFTPTAAGAYSAELDLSGIPTVNSTVFDGPSTEAMIGTAVGPGGIRASGGFVNQQLTSIDCGVIDDLGRTQGFVAEQLGDSCVSRTYATSTADNFVRIRHVGYDAAGALLITGEHSGTFGGLTPSTTLGAFIEKLPTGVGGSPAWRLWFDPGFTISGIVSLEMLPDSTSALVVSNCALIENPTFDEKLPDGDPTCLDRTGTYLAMFGP